MVLSPEQRGEPEWTWLGGDGAIIRVAGHSHVYALRIAMSDLPELDQRKVAVFDAAQTANHEVDSYWDALADYSDPFLLMWGGNEHAVVFMLSDEPITIIGPRGDVPDEPKRVIPYSMVKALWRIWLTPLAQFLQRHPSSQKITVLGTPPPKPDAQVREGIAVEPHFVAMLEARNLTPSDAPVVDAATRVASWDALQECLQEIAAEADAAFLSAPPNIARPDGTLLPKYCAPDATHANSAYGLRMWSHILSEYLLPT